MVYRNFAGCASLLTAALFAAGTVTDICSVDRYGRLILSRSLSFGRNPGNRSVRFVYTRRGRIPP